MKTYFVVFVLLYISVNLLSIYYMKMQKKTLELSTVESKLSLNKRLNFLGQVKIEKNTAK